MVDALSMIGYTFIVLIVLALVTIYFGDDTDE
jgi:preprotein translocase subunit SecE